MVLCLQVILCTKEVSVGARKNAFVLLVEMGHAFIRFGPTPQGELLLHLLSPPAPPAQGDWTHSQHPAARDAVGQGASRGLSCPPLAEAMQRFLLLVYAGLTGSVTMISCTVLALTRLFFEFKGEWEKEVWEVEGSTG